ncbi:hypothetical protein [Actinoplanes sp. NPDC026619]|uniref:hypothetical protein n=1 Tax=Actinoplanes sp. NPDC026619 TaxID=3155798 RepID=UPI0033CFA714
MSAEDFLAEREAALKAGAPNFGRRASQNAPVAGLGEARDRIDQLRRQFQPRRFGTGYSPAQVDRCFDAISRAVGQNQTLPVSAVAMVTTTFTIVPAGYFEADVEAALRETAGLIRKLGLEKSAAESPTGPDDRAERVRALAATFQARRFGAGYDIVEVDTFFRSIIDFLDRRRPRLPVPVDELDRVHFAETSQGYFNAEVDAAMREIKGML